MTTSGQQESHTDAPRAAAVAAAREVLATLGSGADAQAAAAEGEAIGALVEQLGLAPDLVAAALLYPAVRDRILEEKLSENKDLEGISRTIRDLVQLGQFAFAEDWLPGERLAAEQSEMLRKMLLAIVSDVRLVLVRLAEQLCRLRDARRAPKAVQRRLAVETRELYAPLANRLGVWQLKWELEDYAFRYLEPETYRFIARALNEKRGEREAFIAGIEAELRRVLRDQGIDAEISGRPKHIYSIWRKMQRKDRGLENLHDIRAVRVLVDDVSDCYAALGCVHNLWSYLPGEFDDYIANPKKNGYRSLHTAVVGPHGKTVEIQIRTHEMHRQAELGVAAHWRYKEGGGSRAAFDQKIRLLRQLLEPASDGDDLLAQLRDDAFEDRVYAISPKGDVVELPAGATPLDFAYHVHTQVGHRCRGAKVNGKIVPLTQRLANGDQVEIITGRQAQPSRDWLNPQLGYLAGARPRAKVRNWFRQQDRDQHQRQGREILDRELGRLNVRDLATDAVAKQLRFRDTDTLCVALGAGDVTAAAIATAVGQLRQPQQEPGLRVDRPSRRRARSAPDTVTVRGVGDLLSNFARCCRPVPPEPIAGYITQGRGVSIHRRDCGNFLGLDRRHPERVIEVGWGERDDASYPVDLTLRALDRSGLLRDISAVLADENANVTDLVTRTDRKSLQTVMRIGIEVSGLGALSTTISRLEQIPNVLAVSRRG